jgi:tripartite-type tricarboxylate transporter receptor subunit TctC
MRFPAGGPTDAIARILGERLTEKWGQSVVIENRGGAGGNIAARQVAKAEPNGYTVLVTTSAYAVNPSLTANAGYVPETDFKTAVVAVTTPNIIVAAAGLKASNLKELLEAAKTEKFTYGMPGPGTTPHLSAEKIFKVLAKVDIPPVPFTGAAPLLNALLGRHITLACLAMPPTIELIKNGQIKALAVISDKRVPSLPDVPTAMEQGFGDSEESTWMALFVPAGTPAAAYAGPRHE